MPKPEEPPLLSAFKKETHAHQSDHVKAYAVARRVEEPLLGQIMLYNKESAEAGKLYPYKTVLCITMLDQKLYSSKKYWVK